MKVTSVTSASVAFFLGVLLPFVVSADPETEWDNKSQPECYTDLEDVYNELAAIGNSTKQLNAKKRFVICPNTIQKIGYIKPGVGIQNGTSPIIPRPNTDFFCGHDGASSNNCILEGGDMAVMGIPLFYHRQDDALPNVAISGFTFRGQKQYASFIAMEGTVTFRDCIFEDSANFGTMVFNYDSSLGMMFDDKEDDEEDDKQPQQQRLLNVTMENCVFKNLTQTPNKNHLPYAENGIIAIKGSDNLVKMKNCLFVNNHYDNPELGEIGYGIAALKGSVILKNNCFINNEFRGNAPILIDPIDSPLANQYNYLQGNYITQNTVAADSLDCPLAAQIQSTTKTKYHVLIVENRTTDYTCLSQQDKEDAHTTTHQCSIPWYGIHLPTKEQEEASDIKE